MPFGPNFSKTQTYPNVYTDNTIYVANSTSNTPITFPWSLAPTGIPPAYGQFPNLYTISQNNPCLYRLTAEGTGSQGATVQQIQFLFSGLSGSQNSLVFPVTAFTASANFAWKVVIDYFIGQNGPPGYNGWACVNQIAGFVGQSIMGSASPFGTLAGAQAGGNINIGASVGAAGPTINSLHNYIEIIPQ